MFLVECSLIVSALVVSCQLLFASCSGQLPAQTPARGAQTVESSSAGTRQDDPASVTASSSLASSEETSGPGLVEGWSSDVKNNGCEMADGVNNTDALKGKMNRCANDETNRTIGENGGNLTSLQPLSSSNVKERRNGQPGFTLPTDPKSPEQVNVTPSINDDSFTSGTDLSQDGRESGDSTIINRTFQIRQNENDTLRVTGTNGTAVLSTLNKNGSNWTLQPKGRLGLDGEEIVDEFSNDDLGIDVLGRHLMYWFQEETGDNLSIILTVLENRSVFDMVLTADSSNDGVIDTTIKGRFIFLEYSHCQDILVQNASLHKLVDGIWEKTELVGDEISDFICNDDDDGDDSDDTVGFVPLGVYLFFIYLLLVSGIVGNILEFVLMQIRFKSMSFSVYLRFLSVVDSLYLVLACGEDIIENHLIIPEPWSLQDGVWICRSWYWVFIAVDLLSPWYLFAFTFDRFIVVAFPLKHNPSSRRLRFSWAVATTLLLVVFVESAIVISFYEVLDDDSKPYVVFLCYPPFDQIGISFYLHFRTLFLLSGVPCLMILATNIGIIIALKRSSASLRNSLNQSSSSASSSARQTRDNKITLSLLAVSFFAFCSLFPARIVEAIEKLWWQLKGVQLDVDHEPEMPPYLEYSIATWGLLNLVRMLNHSQNFYIMMATSSNFRQEFRLLPFVSALSNSVSAKWRTAKQQCRQR